MFVGISLLFFLALCPGDIVDAERANCVNRSNLSTTSYGSVSPIMEKHEVALLQLLGFGGFSVLLAIIYNAIRKYVFNDVDNLDTTFDAGGQVSTSLTAVTVASQLLWPGDLLQSSSVTAKLIHARFGKNAHALYIFFGLLTNLLVMTALLIASIATFQSMTKDASPEFCVLLIATLFGSYSFVGGLGSTFYVSYFNALLIFVILIILVVNIFYLDQADQVLGSFVSIYEQISCLKGPEGNEEQSYLTFKSEGALIWASLGLLAVPSVVFCDQASWQSRIAAKPVQGVVGFFLGVFMWLVSSCMFPSTGLAYLALSSANTSLTLSHGDIDAGLVLPFIAERTLGYAGGVMIMTMMTMALMSTGSGEVMAVASIIVYDIYQIHINPFRKQDKPNLCFICGREKTPLHDTNRTRGQEIEYCACPPVEKCVECEYDRKTNVDRKEAGRENLFLCKHHGEFRRYQNSLIRFKSWCILWVTIALVPWGLAVNVTGIDLNWIFMAGFTVTTPCFCGVVFSIMWVKATGQGVIAGATAGLIAGVIGLLSLASTYEGGLSNFLENTSQHYSAITGTGSSFVASVSVTVAVSFFTHKITDETAELTEWQKLREIDNPLRPWAEVFREDFPLLNGGRPMAEDLMAKFKNAKWAAFIGGGVILLLFMLIMPSVLTSLHVLTSSQFTIWLSVLQVLFFLLVGFGIVMTPVEEGLIIIKQMRKQKPSEGTQLRVMESISQHCGSATM